MFPGIYLEEYVELYKLLLVASKIKGNKVKIDKPSKIKINIDNTIIKKKNKLVFDELFLKKETKFSLIIKYL